jgi:hypothetical protein
MGEFARATNEFRFNDNFQEVGDDHAAYGDCQLGPIGQKLRQEIDLGVLLFDHAVLGLNAITCAA